MFIHSCDIVTFCSAFEHNISRAALPSFPTVFFSVHTLLLDLVDLLFGPKICASDGVHRRQNMYDIQSHATCNLGTLILKQFIRFCVEYFFPQFFSLLGKMLD